MSPATTEPRTVRAVIGNDRRRPGADAVAARLLGDVDGFAANHWGQRPMLRRGAGSFADLLDTPNVERLLTDLGRRPTFRIVKAGETIPTSEYTRRARVGGVDVDDVADIDRILRLVAGGATVVLQGLQRTWPPLATFCADLANTASHYVQANAYLSPPNAAGLKAHRDVHDVVVVQLEGHKRWDVEGLGEITVGEGDVLYLPARTRHAAWSLDDYSLHLTIGIVATTHRRLIHRIVDELDAGLDVPLPFGYASGAPDGSLDGQLGSVLDRVIEELSKVEVDVVARTQVAGERRRSKRMLGRLVATVDRRAIHDGVVVRRRRGVELELGTGEHGDGLTLSFAGGRLHFPSIAAPALDVVVSEATFAVGDLAGLDTESRAVLARRLIREGLVEMDDGPP